MTVNLEVDVSVGPVRGLPVLPTSVDQTLLNGPAVLRGWSFRDATGDVTTEVEGSVTSPGAGVVIVTTAALAAGTYDVNWTVSLEGTLAAGDANNFVLVNSVGGIIASVNPGVAGNYPQEPVRTTLTAGSVVAVKSIAAGTVGAVYLAQIEVVPSQIPNTVVELQDGNQPLGEISLSAGQSDTRTMPANGLLVGQQIKLHVVSGTVTGVVYAQYDD